MRNKGISLILLVITIIVIVVLAGAVLLAIASNNPISGANKATFLNDVRAFQSELSLYKTNEFIDKLGSYEPALLFANATSVTYGEDIDSTRSINDLIPALGRTSKYNNMFQVMEGKLVYTGSNANMVDWSAEIGLEVVNSFTPPTTTFIPPAQNTVAPKTDMIYVVRFSSVLPITTIDLTGKVQLTDNDGNLITPQPNILIGEVSGTSSDAIREVVVTIKTDNLIDGAYKVKVLEGAAINENDISSLEMLSLIGFDIVDIPPQNPQMSASPTEWTNGNVTVTITYSEDTDLKRISFGTETWFTYETPIVVTENLTTVYAKGLKSSGLESGVSSLTVANIDKVAPTVSFDTNGGEVSSTTVTVSDALSGVNTSTLQYVWSDQNVVTPTSGWTSFTNGSIITKDDGSGTFYLWVRANDNVGNQVVNKSESFIVAEYYEVETTIQNEHKTFAGLTTGFAHDNPVIPAGFVAVSTSAANWKNLSTSWNNGLVIQDASGNQFVWVPVDGTNVTYVKNFTYPSHYGATTSNTSDDTIPVSNETTQITNYSGFYIARYEAMFDWNDGNPRVASKPSINKTITDWSGSRNTSYNGYLFNFVNYTDSKTYSENMATRYSYGTTGVKTGLVTGTQWDTLLQWIQNSGKSVTDSRSWGNYGNSVAPSNVSGFGSLQISGYSEYWKANNIYDIAGNTWTWTNEINSSNRINRGGSSANGGNLHSASYRLNNPIGVVNVLVSFRPVLYITDIPPTNPVISVSPTGWTNGNVTVTINYSTDSATKLYSFDSVTWLNYTSPITVTSNTTVYAKGIKEIGIESGVSSVTIENIDKTAPTVTASSGGSTASSITVNASAIDSQSGLNTSSYQYSRDNGATWTTASSNTSHTFTGLTIGTYQCMVRVADNVGNVGTSSTVNIEILEPLEVGVIATISRTLDGNPPAHNNPIIPAGFKAVNTTTTWPTDWNSGLVIEDTAGNQFVWVPVDGTNVTYSKSGTLLDDTIPVASETTQITNYGGFYIARFTAGNQSGTLVSKQGVNVWNNINYSSAKLNSEAFINNASVKSGLVTGTQWDTLMKWVENSGKNVTTDSRSWGNYNDSIAPANVGNGVVRPNGYSEHWKANNIYDIAGNTWEWTNELNGDNRSNRGGSCADSGLSWPASARLSNSATVVHERVAFRIVLYVL